MRDRAAAFIIKDDKILMNQKELVFRKLHGKLMKKCRKLINSFFVVLDTLMLSRIFGELEKAEK